MKKILTYISIFIVIIIVIFVFISRNKRLNIVIQNPPAREAIAMCYQYSKETSRGFYDQAWLKMSILGDKVTGEYRNLPAEKDSKVGKFAGNVGPMDPKISGRIADVWWDSLAEGMNVREQLNIEFGEGSAVALFGEMIDRGDGVYVYKDVTKLTSGFQMSQTDCSALDDKIIVEKYIRDNVKTIVPEKPVLGGSWYITSVNINPSTKTGKMTYEDGHIQGNKSFSYIRNNNEVKINLMESIPPESKAPVIKGPVACTMDAKQCPDGSYVGRTGPNCEFVCPR
ncbi:TPA: hypothetical protein DEP30_02230 [Candidatus Nomurabacteria bacterium]|nr:MAG: hypothetical protein UR97_C0003G0046 [Candidatus Nomurabacteria bacterium GW2011_GWE2_36_115]KKP94086.1 MAG: hypothetical protein US00_C0003G0010 [Candidatus Nomurabacteria bacterium GW2011_GWF2_36_126]KKP96786.1 MAG: hypothetical protein US04_C0001G0288 [Candidatus Nomurabacteria bacterium GW2011_GWD2_36_14]KKP99610.1 MAG: hypothetical protein US08_C0001G0293 [Candidatus Nomurabacteria bacterium GW2011_GWF2_36_19]KKQ05474.1 MAG: hypothetical protein US17_C0004G0046 [Candidatus Nomuraba